MMSDEPLSNDGQLRKAAILALAIECGQMQKRRRVFTQVATLLTLCAIGLFTVWQMPVSETATIARRETEALVPAPQPKRPAAIQESVQAFSEKTRPAVTSRRPKALAVKPRITSRPIVVSRIETNHQLRKTLSITPRPPMWEVIDDSHFVNELRQSRIPAGLAIIAGKSQLIFHDRP